jgi:hypothetical protein
MPLFSGADGRHNAGGFARLDDHHHLVGLCLFKVGVYEVVAPTFWVVRDFYAPFLSAVLGSVVILVCHLPQNVAAHRINLPINPEKALCSGSVQERLNAAIQEKAVEAAVAELDVILMMLEKGVHGQPPVW